VLHRIRSGMVGGLWIVCCLYGASAQGARAEDNRADGFLSSGDQFQFSFQPRASLIIKYCTQVDFVLLAWQSEKTLAAQRHLAPLLRHTT